MYSFMKLTCLKKQLFNKVNKFHNVLLLFAVLKTDIPVLLTLLLMCESGQ
jgi:hypothetical protein